VQWCSLSTCRTINTRRVVAGMCVGDGLHAACRLHHETQPGIRTKRATPQPFPGRQRLGPQHCFPIWPKLKSSRRLRLEGTVHVTAVCAIMISPVSSPISKHSKASFMGV
jgi:hypothetical protein